MSIPACLLIARRLGCLGAAVLMGLAIAGAQRASTVSSDEPAPLGAESNSLSYSSSNHLAFSDPTPADSGVPAAGGGQYDNRSGGGLHYSWVGGGGFNAPVGNDSPYISWGGNFTAGGGLHFSRGLSLLGEFSFFANKLPGAFLAAGGGQTGNTHIFALTVDPVFDLFPSKTNSVYVVGGGGYYHKSTNFNVLGGYDFYGYPVYVTANSFSSNQAGLNIGFGLTHRLGGVYGDGTMKLFADARYTWIATPKIGETNGLGRTEIIPVTFGVRW
jgi:hypothetical protein